MGAEEQEKAKKGKVRRKEGRKEEKIKQAKKVTIK